MSLPPSIQSNEGAGTWPQTLVSLESNNIVRLNDGAEECVMTAPIYTAGSSGAREEIPGVGVALVNLGSPAAPTPQALRPYLAEFLGDPRVVEPPPPRPVWWAILHGIILRTRPARSAALYRKVWTDAGSPLVAIGRRQAAGVEQRLRARSSVPVHVRLGMTYGEPALRGALRELREIGCGRIAVAPLFPQYSGSTTGSVFDAAARELTAWRVVPDFHFIQSYHDDPGYIAALAASVRERWEAEGEPERLLISYHGIPHRYADAGDPYPAQCKTTSRLLAGALGLEDGRWALAFQSRFGREPWIEPYTGETLEQWGREKLASADVICPGFSADCLETIDEIGRENREAFERAGGGRFRYISCLNERADHLDALACVAGRALGLG